MINERFQLNTQRNFFLVVVCVEERELARGSITSTEERSEIVSED
jgi:hypothetical protein